MILTIWRHGSAVAGADDPRRRLTGSGRDDVKHGSHCFREICNARLITPPHRILHSPLVRTVQTAEIIAAEFTHALVTPERALQPGSDAAAVDSAVHQLTDIDLHTQHIVLVSHQPLITELIEHYLGSANGVPFVAPGGLVSMQLEPLAAQCGTLLFFALPPGFEAAN